MTLLLDGSLPNLREGWMAGEDWLLGPDVLVDHFRIMRPLGRGGMAEVYLARDTKLGRKVALKVIKPERLGTKEAIERFLFEARATARFSHPHIVTIYGVGEDQGRPYVALEYLEGHSLRQRMQQEKISVAETMRIGLAIAEALKEAHAGDIQHRDLKPENVILSKDGRLRVLDFGLAGVQRRAGGQNLNDSVIEEPASAVPAGVVGTPAYMAPEQWEEKETTGAVDIWALGVILYELLTGRRPYEESSSVKLAARILGPYPVPPLDGDGQWPVDLGTLVMECLQKDPVRRPGARELVRRLSELLSGEHDRESGEESPFRGLLAFDERHKSFFFGREADIAAFVERIRSQPVNPLVGPSGAGKTSFIQAGVIPRLRERGPAVVLQMRPGHDPFTVLAARVVAARRLVTQKSLEQPSAGGLDESAADDDASASTEVDRLARQLHGTPHLLNLVLHRLHQKMQARVVLFVDQLEELYTLGADAATRQAFMQAVCAAADDPGVAVRVIFALREEFLSRLAEGPGVREVLSQITVLRTPGQEALHEILTRPVEVVGNSWEDPRMVWEMVGEVEGEVSPLPLLQFAGRLLWDRRDKKERRLRRSDYQDMGGVAGALAQHADGVLGGLSTGEVRLARAILLRLVTGEGTRKVLSRTRLLEGLAPGAEDVLKRLTAARLITTRQSETEDEAELELVHESLIVTWSRLARWIDESREELVFLSEVSQAAELWEKRGRRAEEVWQGDALREAARAVEHCSTDIPSQVQRFLDAGRRKERRRVVRSRSMLVIAFLALAALALVFMARESETRRQKELAEHERAGALREGAAAAYLQGHALEARAKLRAALEVEDTVPGRALWSRLQHDPIIWKKELPEIPLVTCISPDGGMVAAMLFNGWIMLVDARSAESHMFRASPEGYARFRTSPDSRSLAFAGEDGTVGLWSLERREARILGNHIGKVYALAFSPDANLLATSGEDRTVRLWDLRRGTERRLDAGNEEEESAARRILEKPVTALLFAPDGKTLLTGSEDGAIVYWSLETASPGRVIPGDGKTVLWMEIKGRGENAGLVARGSKRIRVIDDGGASPRAIGTSIAVIQPSVDFYADARKEQGDLVVRRVADGSVQSVLEEAGHKMHMGTFSEDGTRYAAVDGDFQVRVWEVASGRLINRFGGFDGKVASMWLSQDGRRMALTTFDSMLHYLDVDRRQAPDVSRGHTNQVIGVAFSPDGKLLASGGHDRTVRLWDVATGREVHTFEGHTEGIWRVVYNPNGKQVASAGMDRTVRLWDVTSSGSRKPRVLEGHKAMVGDLDYTPDGKLLASGGNDGTVRIWDTGTGELQRVLEGWKCCASSVAFHPDGRRLAVITGGRDIRVFDVQNGREREHIVFASAQEKQPEHAILSFNQYINNLAYSPDGRLLAFGGSDGMLRIRDMQTGQVREIGKHWGWIYELVFHPDGKRVGTASRDDTARIWDLESGDYVEYRGHLNDTNRLSFSPDGRLLATAGDDATVRVWNVNPRGSTMPGSAYWRTGVLLPAGNGAVRQFNHQGWIDPAADAAVEVAPAGWRRAVEAARLASVSDDGDTLCAVAPNGVLELWQPDGDRRVWARSLEDVRQVRAIPFGCAVIVPGKAQLYTRNKRVVDLCFKARALDWDRQRGELLVVTGQNVEIFDADGKQRALVQGKKAATAVSRVRDPRDPAHAWLVLGTQAGNIESVAASAGDADPLLPLRDVPRSPVVRLVEGPPGSVALGYADGTVGLWDVLNGARLASVKLHGPVDHLLVHGKHLVAATELGDFHVFDLGIYQQNYCTLMHRVWAVVPAVWKEGRPVLRVRPADHPCLREPAGARASPGG